MELKIYFACPECEEIFRASQVRQPERVSGRFKCERCLATIHEWDGVYEYLRWARVQSAKMKTGNIGERRLAEE